MKHKNDIEVLIGGTKYTISGYESTEYIMKIATYINDKLLTIRKNIDPRLLDNEIKNVLLQINIADDYYKQVAKTTAVTEEKNDADKALFELKHELMTLQEKLEKLETQNRQLKDNKSSDKKNSSGTEDMLEEEKKKTAEVIGQLEEEKKKTAEAIGQLEEEKKKTAEALGQLEEEKKKTAEALGQLEEEKKKTAEVLEQLEKERKKVVDALVQVQEEKDKYDELERTVDELFGSMDS